jgi:hypothetical protein
MKILLVGYCALLEGFQGAMKSLNKLYDYEIDFFPLFTYWKHHTNEDSLKYLVEFAKGNLKNELIYDTCVKTSKSQPDIILWWYFPLSPDQLKKIKTALNVLHIFYSWDDPFRLESLQKNMIYGLMDICYTCCERSISFYKENGCTNVYYAHPGYDPEIHHPAKDDRYQCDISIICTNLYENTNQSGFNINRRKLLDLIYKNQDIKLHVWGPDFLQEIYPKAYKGYITFNESHKVFSNSKISLNTHVRRNGMKYINERTCQILGSGGLLLIDDINGIDELMDRYKECVIINETDPVGQIKYILKNYSNYLSIKKAGLELAQQKFTWDTWAQIIHQGIMRFLTEKQMIIRIKEPPLKPTDKVISQILIICKLIRTSHLRTDDYFKVLSSLINKYDIDINGLLHANMGRLIKYSFCELASN